MSPLKINFEALHRPNWTAQEKSNVELVSDFVQSLMNDHDFDRVLEKFDNSLYVQHNTAIPDGIQGLVKFVKNFAKRFPEYGYDVKRIMADDDLVMFHSHCTTKAKHRGDDGKGINLRRLRRGLSLLEVIAALVLMGTIVVTTLLAFSKHRRQLALSKERLQAAEIAEELLPQLIRSERGIVAGQRGTIAGRPDWFWQTSLVGTTVVATLPMHVIRFEIYSKRESESVLTRIEMVHPQPQGN